MKVVIFGATAWPGRECPHGAWRYRPSLDGWAAENHASRIRRKKRHPPPAEPRPGTCPRRRSILGGTRFHGPEPSGQTSICSETGDFSRQHKASVGSSRLPYRQATAPIEPESGVRACYRNCATSRGRGTCLARTEKLERETGFEPATSTLARSHSTTELFPLAERLKYHTAPAAFKNAGQTTPEGAGHHAERVPRPASTPRPHATPAGSTVSGCATHEPRAAPGPPPQATWG